MSSPQYEADLSENLNNLALGGRHENKLDPLKTEFSKDFKQTPLKDIFPEIAKSRHYDEGDVLLKHEIKTVLDFDPSKYTDVAVFENLNHRALLSLPTKVVTEIMLLKYKLVPLKTELREDFKQPPLKDIFPEIAKSRHYDEEDVLLKHDGGKTFFSFDPSKYTDVAVFENLNERALRSLPAEVATEIMLLKNKLVPLKTKLSKNFKQPPLKDLFPEIAKSRNYNKGDVLLTHNGGKTFLSFDPSKYTDVAVSRNFDNKKLDALPDEVFREILRLNNGKW